MTPSIHIDPAHMLDGARVLVLEDDYFISVELDRILTGAGAEVIGPCRSLAQARDLIETVCISCAVLDVRLDRETSLPAARQLNERGIPFVFVTGQLHTDQLLAEWQDAKIITKPFHHRTILVAVANMLEAGRPPPRSTADDNRRA
jgi:DNA-binding response OmpR family regulator